MGLIIDKELANGVRLEYFRIVSLTTIVNQQSVIEVAGYPSQAKRDEEQEAGVGFDVYIETQYIPVEYDPDFSVNKAYALLKAMPEWEDAEDVIDAWAASTAYYVGDAVIYEDSEYECVQSHTSQAGWEPPNVPALWKAKGGDEVPVWSQPDSTNPYNTGDKVHYPDADGPVYESTIDNNVFSPEAYPQGWQLVEGGE